VKAALIGADRALTVTDIERPVPAVGEVLIDVRYCGVCGSDLHMLGLPADLVPTGHVLGHELTGVVAAVGPGVTGWSAGQAPRPCRSGLGLPV
jgi:D-arabinose 1-dehydrogenase-like Zn-dependent alcohol dehydrogenase